ncbi:sensor domain-containing diguanylate cyclase [Sporosarcina sp. FSL W8-0480]|uniref:sensor domain-containing diguanylate cyclase n=1 Tax=Sporosarcina sp. FSL W8-0480 TaxID=2954701 RepID=UPI0030D982C9
MYNHELTLIEMKCDVFDLFSSKVDELSMEEMLHECKKMFMSHFEIKNADILLYDNNRFIPLIEGEVLDEESKSTSGIRSSKDQPIVNIMLLAHTGDINEDSLIIRDNRLNPLAALIFTATDKWHAFAESPYLKDIKKVLGTFVGQVVKVHQLSANESMYRRLFEVTEHFNSTMDSDVIIEEMMRTVLKSFSGYEVQLLLSQGYKDETKGYRLFDYMNERASAVDAFLSGDLTIEKNAEDLNGTLMNAPIGGRQGTYGVLQIVAFKGTNFTSTQKNFVKLITNVAGSALENANLYEQSSRLVSDLQLVDETSRELNSNLDIECMYGYLNEQFMKSFSPDEIAFVTLKGEAADSIEFASHTPLFEKEKGKKMVESIFDRLKEGEDSIFDVNSKSADGISDFTSLVALPITNNENMIGFVILLHKDDSFSFDNFKLLRSLIGHSSLAISNVMLRDQLQDLVNKDNLTKLYTRTYFDQYVATRIENEESGIFFLMDIDDFKLVNDTFGHYIGDIVLQQIASFIISKVDGIGFASRWGGEEIAIFLPDATFDNGVEFAESLVKEIPAITEPSVTVSIGMGDWQANEGASFNELFQSIDKALYHAKGNGKNQFIIHGVASAN